MTSKKIYKFLNSLGMIENIEYDSFEEITKDLCSIINFVDELTVYNDMNTMSKFLVLLLHYIGKEN